MGAFRRTIRLSSAGWKPEIYSYGHRNPLGLWYRESTGELWSTEEGPQGGDELNLIKAGKNYGWPLCGLGRNYDGSVIGKGFSGADVEDPVVFWVPAIAISGSFDSTRATSSPRGEIRRSSVAMRNGTGQFIARVTFNPEGCRQVAITRCSQTCGSGFARSSRGRTVTSTC